MRTALQRMRQRPRRWIALVAAFALLFNQIALAQHLCLYTAGGHPQVTVVVDADQLDSGCHPAAAGESLSTDTDSVECAVHCDDGDKQTRDVLSLKVPDLIAASSEVAQLRSTRGGRELIAIAELPRPAQPRRTTDFGVLLI